MKVYKLTIYSYHFTDRPGGIFIDKNDGYLNLMIKLPKGLPGFYTKNQYEVI